MKKYRTVNEVRRALDKYLQAHGDSHDGAHYVRPDGTRGPVVGYLRFPYNLEFAVDRDESGGWAISNAWFGDDKLDSSTLWSIEYAEVGE